MMAGRRSIGDVAVCLLAAVLFFVEYAMKSERKQMQQWRE